MKRRNAESSGKRRPIKRSKIPESFYGNLFMYLKFLLVWLLVLLADFILEFRFEYLWPFWLLVRSVYDSFKYQGLAFSVFFVCIALTSDMICFLFIPVHWLFFAASTYVWVQFVWHTERGICLPTVSLWLLFVYIEASVRLREIKNLPFHLDLCRPFAAHCIGYPVVTLGFGFKSYIGYRMRQRKQKEVAKENEFYVQLLKQALPQEPPGVVACPAEKGSSTKANEDCSNSGGGGAICSNGVASGSCSPPASAANSKKSSAAAALLGPVVKPCGGDAIVSKFSEIDPKDAHKKQNNSAALEKELEYMENQLQKQLNADFEENVHDAADRQDKNYKSSSNGSGGGHGGGAVAGAGTVVNARAASQQQQQQQQQQHRGWNHVRDNNKENVAASPAPPHPHPAATLNIQANVRSRAKNNARDMANHRDEHLLRLEADIKRLKADLQSSQQCEVYLRSQVNTLVNGERSVKNELMQVQHDNENLQTKLHGLVTARQHDKQSLGALEKKLQEERKGRLLVESQLSQERKAAKKIELEVANAATASNSGANAAAGRLSSSSSSSSASSAQQAGNSSGCRLECTEMCKVRRRDLEQDNKQLRREVKSCEDRLRQAEREAQSLRPYKDSHNESEVLMSALAAMQDKNAHLENSLSAETRLKLDLFSALGEAKRQLEIAQSLVMQKEKEIEDLKSKVAEVMAVMPQTTSFPPVSLDSSSSHSGSSSIMAPPHHHHHHHHFNATSKFVVGGETSKIATSNLDPNASVYTPKALGGVATAADLF